ncbi:MAG: DUF1003 domain-containing protein [Deltaproteobacteria bacterium]|nr:DUF1003 domain-containing protein [Deltaproteobacteria bacterium]
MSHSKSEKAALCQICGSHDELKPAILVRPALAKIIRRDHGDFDDKGWICAIDYKAYRGKFVEELIRTEKGQLTDLENEVIKSLKEGEIFAHDPIKDLVEHLTLGQKMADKIAEFGGSWGFISIFGVILFSWMGINTHILLSKPFDPYPFIFLNLMLSCIAAIQAPVIMMSQKRQEARDRESSMHDYQINLKAELEIRNIQQKLDHLMSSQWDRLLELQTLQMDLMEEVRAAVAVFRENAPPAPNSKKPGA